MAAGGRLRRRIRCCTRLPSQADEVADVGRQLGLSTVLAIGQILDQTAARMRVSMHGRTLVEMAIVRICQLGELDDLAALVAELRGQPAQRERRHVANAPVVACATAEPQKKTMNRRRTSARSRELTPLPNAASAFASPAARVAASSRIDSRTFRSAASDARLATTEVGATADDSPHCEPNRCSRNAQRSDGRTAAACSNAMPRRRDRRAANSWRKSPSSHSSAARWNCSMSPPDKLRYTPPEGEA